MKIPLVVLTLLFATTLHAGSGSTLVLANYRPAESPVSISVPAHYLAAEIRIECDEEDWALKLSAIEEARRLLTRASEKEGFKVRIDQALIFATSYSKFSFSSSRGPQEALSDVLVLAPLSESTDLIPIVKKYRSIVSELRLTKKVKVSLGSIALALENPEEFRSELLKKIRAHVEASAKILFDAPEYVVSGLDGPVHVRQRGEREIAVFLPFQVTYGQRK